MESSSGGVLRAEVILLIKSRSDLQSSWCSPAEQQCCPWKEESGQSGTGLVTKKARLKKSYCHQRQRQMIREEKKGKRMPKTMNTFSSYLDPQRIPTSQAERDRERQYPAQFASPVRTAVEKSRLRTWLSPAA